MVHLHLDLLLLGVLLLLHLVEVLVVQDALLWCSDLLDQGVIAIAIAIVALFWNFTIDGLSQLLELGVDVVCFDGFFVRLVLELTIVVLEFALLFEALERDLRFTFLFHLSVADFVFDEGVFEPSSWHLIDEVSLIFQGLLLLGQFNRLSLLLKTLLNLQVQRLLLVDLLVRLLSLGYLSFAPLLVLLDLIEGGLVLQKLLLH